MSRGRPKLLRGSLSACEDSPSPASNVTEEHGADSASDHEKEHSEEQHEVEKELSEELNESSTDTIPDACYCTAFGEPSCLIETLDASSEENDSLMRVDFESDEIFPIAEEQSCKSTEFLTAMTGHKLSCEQEFPIWSILTDNMQYVTDTYLDSSKGESLQFSPMKGPKFETWKRKLRNRMEKDKLIPPEAEAFDEQEDRYMDMTVDLKDTYNPETDISTTYLTSTNEAEFESQALAQQLTQMSEVFKVGTFPLSANSRSKGKLADGTPVRVLVDTGATKCIA